MRAECFAFFKIFGAVAQDLDFVGDLGFGFVPLLRSLRRRSVFAVFDVLEEHCLTEDGQAVAQDLGDVPNAETFLDHHLTGSSSSLSESSRVELSGDFVTCFLSMDRMNGVLKGVVDHVILTLLGEM